MIQVYKGVEVTDKDHPMFGLVGVVVGAADPVAVKFEDPDGKHPDAVIDIPETSLRVL